MDAFWTDDEISFRKNAADYFRRQVGPPPSKAMRPDKIWGDLDGAPAPDGNAASLAGSLGGRVSIFEEAACYDPKLGRDLLSWRAGDGRLDPLEERLCRLSRLAGTAAHVLEAGTRAAREQGAFSSSLMGCREVQERLARLVSGADLIRLGTCRLCRLLERGERGRAARESGRLEASALALAGDVRSVALSLLGGTWVEANLPADDPPYDDERTWP